MKLQQNNIEKIIFDLDGVITSEQSYWDAAALMTYELIYSRDYYGNQDIDREWCYKNLRLISDIVFCGGRTIKAVKKLGVNTNWDLAYLVFCVTEYLMPHPETFEQQLFESVCMFIDNMEITPPELYVGVEGLVATVIPKEVGFFKRNGDGLWKQLYDGFNTWYHGDGVIDGTKAIEQPLLKLESIKETLQKLKDKGYKLGIGTGRPTEEALYPMRKWGLMEYFDENMCAYYNDVSNAESLVEKGVQLAKPHPFVFLKAAFGSEYSDKELLEKGVPIEKTEKCLVIGDAASDMFAAQKGGFLFGAVLTGVTGENGRAFFEENQADIILDSVLDLAEMNNNADV